MSLGGDCSECRGLGLKGGSDDTQDACETGTKGLEGSGGQHTGTQMSLVPDW